MSLIRSVADDTLKKPFNRRLKDARINNTKRRKENINFDFQKASYGGFIVQYFDRKFFVNTDLFTSTLRGMKDFNPDDAFANAISLKGATDEVKMKSLYAILIANLSREIKITI